VMVNTGLRTFVPSTRPITVKPPQGMRIDNSRWLAFLVALMLLVTAFFGLRVRRSPAAAALLVAIVVILLSVACNGGGQAGTPNGTPAGTYQIGITGTSGVLSHTANVTLQVE
jgi:hypothetical protein